MTPRINLSITRANGRTSTVKTAAKQPPTPEMIAAAEALAAFLSTGEDPHAVCKLCGVRRDVHQDDRFQPRHKFEPM